MYSMVFVGIEKLHQKVCHSHTIMQNYPISCVTYSMWSNTNYIQRHCISGQNWQIFYKEVLIAQHDICRFYDSIGLLIGQLPKIAIFGSIGKIWGLQITQYHFKAQSQPLKESIGNNQKSSLTMSRPL